MANVPKGKYKPKPQKKPTSARSQATDLPLSWRLEHVDLDGEWGWHELAQENVTNLHAMLTDFEQETRRKLEVEKKLVAIPCYDLCQDAQGRLKTLGFEESDSLWQLRLSPESGEKWRAWGLATEHYFYLLWWDPKHTVCPSGPRKGVAKHH